MSAPAFVVESVAKDKYGEPCGTFRYYLDDEDKARRIVEEGAKNGEVRTYRSIELEKMPTAARENLLRARREARA